MADLTCHEHFQTVKFKLDQILSKLNEGPQDKCACAVPDDRFDKYSHYEYDVKKNGPIITGKFRLVEKEEI